MTITTEFKLFTYILLYEWKPGQTCCGHLGGLPTVLFPAPSSVSNSHFCPLCSLKTEEEPWNTATYPNSKFTKVVRTKNEPLHVMSAWAGSHPSFLVAMWKEGIDLVVDHGPLYLTPLVIHTCRATQFQNQYRLTVESCTYSCNCV